MKFRSNKQFNGCAIASWVQKLGQQVFVALFSLTLLLGTTATILAVNSPQMISQAQPETLIAYEKDWQKDLERKEKTVEKHGESVRKYVDQAQQYNAANPNSKIDQPSVVGREVKSPREKGQRKHKNFFKNLFQSDSSRRSSNS
ncbi:MAG: hypothetical protein ACLFV6_08510 [Spirulinaceae cyanobacterium]